MKKSYACWPLIYFVYNTTVQKSYLKLITG